MIKTGKKSWISKIANVVIFLETTVFSIALLSFIGCLFDNLSAEIVLFFCLLLISFFSLLLIPFYRFTDAENNNRKQIIVSFLTGFGTTIGCIGISFRMMYWVGTDSILTMSIFLLPISIIILLFMYGKLALNYITIKSLIALIAVFFAWKISTFSLFTMRHAEDTELVNLCENIKASPENVTLKKEFLKYVEHKYNIYLPLD